MSSSHSIFNQSGIMLSRLFATALLFTFSTASTNTSAGLCQCDAGDYWCSKSNVLRVNYNCSSTKREKFIYNKILMADDGPTTEQCNSMMNTCIQQPPTASNHTCDDSCYNFCWIQDVGDCADDDDSQTLCVSLCQDWCVRHRCGTTTVWSNNMCERDCSNKYMNVVKKDDINFVDYTNCMAECTPVPVRL